MLKRNSCCVYAAAFLRAARFGKRAGNVLKDKAPALNAIALLIQGQVSHPGGQIARSLMNQLT